MSNIKDFINIVNKTLLNEATEPKSNEKNKFDFLQKLSQEQPVANKNTNTSSNGTKAIPGKISNKKQTSQAFNQGDYSMNDFDAIYQMMQKAGPDTVVSDDDLTHDTTMINNNDEPLKLTNQTKPTNDNLPMIINHNITEYNPKAIIPKWHQIKNLPSYMISQIRSVGRKVFAQFTTTPIEQIQMICTLMNSDNEVKTVMNWIKQNASLKDKVEMTFPNDIKALVKLYKYNNFAFLCVKDFMGIYIYAWIEEPDKQITGY